MSEPSDQSLPTTHRFGHDLEASPADSGSLDDLPRAPAAVGPYEVVGTLGRGGMGVVYRAHDPRLDRDVAVKLVLDDDHWTEPARLRREAQALAALSHPHVVQVFEVGVDRGRVYIAMEHVEGRSLRRWLESAPPRAEILDRLFEVARGLGAAHLSGLLHRDIKPSNIMIGTDGRARILDFGLARLLRPTAFSGSELQGETPGPDASHTSLVSTEDAELTAPGTIMGTPRYMAPELLRGGTATESSDLFAYCVTAYQALTGVHPFGGRPPTQADGTPSLVAPEAKPDARLERLLVVLRRGLAVDPLGRWPSMQALLEQLEAARAPRRSRRGWWVLGTGGVLTVALLAWPTSEPAPRACAEGDAAQDLWSEERRDAIRDAMLATERDHAADTWQRVAETIDARVAEWTETRARICDPDREDEVILEAQLQCLERSRQGLATVLQVLQTPSAEIVDAAVAVVDGLGTPRDCSDPEHLSTQPARPVDPETLAALVGAEEGLARFVATTESGDIEAAIAMIEPLDRSSASLSYAPFSVELDVVLGTMLAEHERRDDEASTRLERAYYLARAESMPRMAFEAAIGLAFVELTLRHRLDEGTQWVRHAEAALDEVPDPRLEANMLTRRAEAQEQDGRADDAIASLQRAIELLESLGDQQLVDLSKAISALGIQQMKAGQISEAKISFERALEVRRQALGPRHPSLVRPLVHLAMALSDLDRHDRAQPLLEEALARLDAADRRRSADGIQVLQTLAWALRDQQHYEESLAAIEEAREIALDVYGPKHPTASMLDNSLSVILKRLGRNEEAVAALRRSLDQRREMLGPDHPKLMPPLVNLGWSLLELDRVDEAAVQLEHALRIVESGDQGDFARAKVHVLANVVARRQGRTGLAVERGQRAIAFLEGLEGQADDLARARLELAESLRADGSPRAAIELVRRARQQLLPFRESSDDAWSSLESWLAEHDPAH